MTLVVAVAAGAQLTGIIVADVIPYRTLKESRRLATALAKLIIQESQTLRRRSP